MALRSASIAPFRRALAHPAYLGPPCWTVESEVLLYGSLLSGGRRCVGRSPRGLSGHQLRRKHHQRRVRRRCRHARRAARAARHDAGRRRHQRHVRGQQALPRGHRSQRHGRHDQRVEAVRLRPRRVHLHRRVDQPLQARGQRQPEERLPRRQRRHRQLVRQADPPDPPGHREQRLGLDQRRDHHRQVHHHAGHAEARVGAQLQPPHHQPLRRRRSRERCPSSTAPTSGRCCPRS